MTFFFTADTRDWLYSKVRRTVTFLVDGKRIIVPDADWDGAVISADSLLEEMTTQVPTRQVLRIIQGQKVEGQIAFTTFELLDENLEVSVRFCFQLPTSLARMTKPNSISVSRDIPLQRTILPGGESPARTT